MTLVLFDKLNPAIGRITLNDPDSLNAMSEKMADEFAALVVKLRGDTALRCLILTGAGRAFSAGGDLEMLERKTALSAAENKRLMLKFYDSFLSLLELNVPLIAAINGHAIGAGLCVACACDVRIAAVGAKLGFTFTKLGLHPGMGATWFLPRVVGLAAATELVITGRVVEAQDALKMGLVSRVLPADQIMNEVQRVADEILQCGPESIAQVLQSMRNPLPTLRESLVREADFQSVNYASAQFKEGVRATREKRKPSW
ncbi:MAG: enoyl-CoA hydratase/isomerase family protein [Oligoflexia bacterium]|nr:enoyl-CoA hydratase/isomerase family protein [Oligoflexia bacterium]